MEQNNPQRATPFASGGLIPLPNALVDKLLPTLKDSELRLLLVVLRQTLGWRDSQGRTKARDWLSHGQLRRRTGRSSEAVSGAIAALVRRGLIIVEDSVGNPLSSPEERRRHLGRLYFRPGERWIQGSQPGGHQKRAMQCGTQGGVRPERTRPVVPLVLHEPGWSRALWPDADPDAASRT